MKTRVLGILVMVLLGTITALAVVSVLHNPVLQTTLSPHDPTGSVQYLTHTHMGRDGLMYNITLNTSLNTVRAPEKIMIYRSSPRPVCEDDALGLAKKFGVDGNVIVGNLSIVIKSPNQDLIILERASGSQQYRRHFEDDRPRNEKENASRKVPADDEAIGIARGFLQEKALLSDDVGPGVVCPDHSHAIARGNGRPRFEYDTDVTVRFIRKDLDGIPFTGSGIQVTLGNEGKVVSYGSTLRMYEPYKEFAIKTPQEAFQELATNGVFTSMTVSPEMPFVKMDKVYLAFDPPGYEDREYYLNPIWIFEGSYTGISPKGEYRTYPVREYIGALKEVTPDLKPSKNPHFDDMQVGSAEPNL